MLVFQLAKNCVKELPLLGGGGGNIDKKISQLIMLLGDILKFLS